MIEIPFKNQGRHYVTDMIRGPPTFSIDAFQNACSMHPLLIYHTGAKYSSAKSGGMPYVPGDETDKTALLRRRLRYWSTRIQEISQKMPGWPRYPGVPMHISLKSISSI